MTDAARLALVPVPAAVPVGKLAHARVLHPHRDGDDVGALRARVQATVLATR